MLKALATASALASYHMLELHVNLVQKICPGNRCISPTGFASRQRSIPETQFDNHDDLEDSVFCHDTVFIEDTEKQLRRQHVSLIQHFLGCLAPVSALYN